MDRKNEVHFTRYTVPVEIRFTNGRECCEWCNHSFMNMKRHFECDITHEEMVSPKDSIGWDCPLRKLEKEESNWESLS
jgi:hypothetical protein